MTDPFAPRPALRPPQGPYLEASCEVRVRFQEVDTLGIVWHGHYLSYCEDARQAFGRTYELDYAAFGEAGVAVPLVHAQLDYFAPARSDQVLTVRARHYPERAARLAFRYAILDAEGQRLASALTVQAFTDLQGRLQLVRPPIYARFLERWEAQLQGASP